MAKYSNVNSVGPPLCLHQPSIDTLIAQCVVVQLVKSKNYKGYGSGSRARKKRMVNRYSHKIDLEKYVKYLNAKLPATHAPIHTNIQSDTGAAGKSEVTFSKMTATSDPADLLNWPIDDLSVIKEKNGNNTLTRMHQIRGRFGGQAHAPNMFLGTALSNNFHDQSHFARVESWIEQAMPLATNSVINYVVEPQFGIVPTYITKRIDASPKGRAWKTKMTNWCKQATPLEFKTTITHYYIDKKLKPRQGGPTSKILSAET